MALAGLIALACATQQCGRDEHLSAASKDAGENRVFDASDATVDAPSESGDTDAADANPPPLRGVTFERLFPTDERPSVVFQDCAFSSPLLRTGSGGKELIVAASDRVVALDPESGALRYEIALPAPSGERPFVIGTPVLVFDRLVVAYHTTIPATESQRPGRDVMDPRATQIVATLDLNQRRVDPEFPFVVLSAERPAFTPDQTVTFRADKALQRASLVHAPETGRLGRVYVTFGNGRDLQPWHGWAFEISLDAWLASGPGAAIESVLLITPEHDCGPEGASGSRTRSCGGGLWAPSGPLLVNKSGGYELILAPGNGQLDPLRGDYANTLMRVGKGLVFEDGCDRTLCQEFDPNEPASACIESCSNLFIPRIPSGEPALLPETGVCDESSLFECWEKLDYVGGSTPVRIELDAGEAVLAYPTKDGHVYLVDADHLGRLHQRKKLVDVCGTPSDPCQADWAGMIVTQPAVGTIGGKKIIVVPTFMPDRTHAAGVFGLELSLAGGSPRLETLWTFPHDSSPEATTRFRLHPSRAAISSYFGSAAPLVYVVEPGRAANELGQLSALKLEDGTLLGETAMAGRGQRYIEPLTDADVVYTPSCASDFGSGTLEAHRVSAAP